MSIASSIAGSSAACGTAGGANCVKRSSFLGDCKGRFASSRVSVVMDGNGPGMQNGTSVHVRASANGTNGNASGSGDRLGTHGKPVLTSLAGHPISDDNNSVTVGDSGTLLMEDFHFLEKQAHMNRERIPERVVHAKGSGAHGYFEVTDDVTHLCKAKFLGEVGKRTPIFVRFSAVSGESGYVDSARDVRGFAIKFYTEEGNWDLVGNNTPVFFVRDPIKFPDLIHSQKRNPQTHMKDPNAFWDFLSLVPESVHQVLFNFTPRGIPDGYRHMHGFGSHTFKMVNKDMQQVWVKFHMLTDQGIKNLTHQEALKIAGINPDYFQEDLFSNIEKGNFPSWTFYVQVMPYDDAPKYKWDPFDLTKVWLHADYPLQKVGKLVLDRNVTNYFAEVEQVAFSPAHMPPGIEPSPDRVLQSRLFAYDDTARYRLGSNYLQIPVNRCPFAKPQTYVRDGLMTVTDNGGSKPNYYPNSFSDTPKPDPNQLELHPYKHEGGIVGRYPPEKWLREDDIYEQPRLLWNKLSEEDKQETATNIATHLRGAAGFIQERQVGVFHNVSPDLANRLKEKLDMKKKKNEPYSMVA